MECFLSASFSSCQDRNIPFTETLACLPQKGQNVHYSYSFKSSTHWLFYIYCKTKFWKQGILKNLNWNYLRIKAQQAVLSVSLLNVLFTWVKFLFAFFQPLGREFLQVQLVTGEVTSGRSSVPLLKRRMRIPRVRQCCRHLHGGALFF